MKRVNIVYFLPLIMMSCKQEIPDNCEGEYYFKRPYFTSHPIGRMKLRDTLTFSIKLPLKEYNFRSDSIVNISRFNKVLCGFNVYRILKDSSSKVGFKTVGAKTEFNYFSNDLKLDFTEGVAGKDRVRYYLKKGDSVFSGSISFLPKQNGTYLFILLDGIIEDAFCNAGVGAFWGNYSSLDLIKFFESISGMKYSVDQVELFKSNYQSYCLEIE